MANIRGIYCQKHWLNDADECRDIIFASWPTHLPHHKQTKKKRERKQSSYMI